MSVLVTEQKRLMVWPTLLFIVILTTVSEVTSLHCSDQQLPASGDDDLQQVTTLQYCLVDDCTIKRIDTGEELDIAYTTDSLIVTTQTDGRTSLVIAKKESELSCAKLSILPDQLNLAQFLLVMSFAVLIVMASGFIIIMHVIFKELRTTVSKLLMLYNISVVCHVIAATPLLVTRNLVSLHSLAFCYGWNVIFLLSAISIETFATCILYYTVYVMYCSHKLRIIEPEDSKRHIRYFMTYSLATIMVGFAVVVSYDFATGDYKDAILPNGRCFDAGHDSATSQISNVVIAVNKVSQVVLFITYLYYAYKVNSSTSNPEILKSQQFLLHKLALAMGAVVGLTYFVFALGSLLHLDMVILLSLAGILFLVQQYAIVAIFLCSKKMRRLYGECFSCD